MHISRMLVNSSFCCAGIDAQYFLPKIRDDWSWRYLITFASIDVADEWWRTVSTSSNTNYVASVHRVSPQYYTHDPLRANAAYSITDVTVARRFIDRIFFTLLSDRDGRAMQIVPHIDITERLSGRA